MSWRRRQLLAGAAAAPLAACLPAPRPGHGVQWVGASVERGHRLRNLDPQRLPTPSLTRRVGAVVVGGGIAGLSALRALVAAGVQDAVLLELEDSVGGNSRGHQMAGLGCPLGAHYLPVPGPAAHEVSAWLHEIGLLRFDSAGVHANERYLCHSPQERLFIDGAWQDGLLPSAHGRPSTLAQYRRFGQQVDSLQRSLGFSLPTTATRWTAGHAALDGQTFQTWLAAQGLDDTRLLGHLDYCCRDDYGAGLATVSAWAGLHYFASRHGFQVPGDEVAEREPVFTWPEGNAFLVQALAEPLTDRLRPGRTVLRVTEDRHQVKVLAWDAATDQVELWTAARVVLATPLFVTRRLLEGLDAPLASALRLAADATVYAPWLVANLQLRGPLLDRIGAPASWDNVVFTPAGRSPALGYVDARHQSMRPDTGQRSPQLLTAYLALPTTQRATLLAATPEQGLRWVLGELAGVHPDLAGQLQQADLMRWGHAMSIPVPGVRGQPARQALREARARVAFAHADLAGYSVFEEAFTLGARVV
jgi:predicted NAD/FAD-dependent oxidoreductase